MEKIVLKHYPNYEPDEVEATIREFNESDNKTVCRKCRSFIDEDEELPILKTYGDGYFEPIEHIYGCPHCGSKFQSDECTLDEWIDNGN